MCTLASSSIPSVSSSFMMHFPHFLCLIYYNPISTYISTLPCFSRLLQAPICNLLTASVSSNYEHNYAATLFPIEVYRDWIELFFPSFRFLSSLWSIKVFLIPGIPMNFQIFSSNRPCPWHQPTCHWHTLWYIKADMLLWHTYLSVLTCPRILEDREMHLKQKRPCLVEGSKLCSRLKVSSKVCLLL